MFELYISRTLKTMSMCHRTSVVTEYVNRHHVVAMERHQSVRRSDKLHGSRPICQLVAHQFRHGQRYDCLFQRRLQGYLQTLSLHQLSQE